jgi:ArsR family transcriptional regulator
MSKYRNENMVEIFKALANPHRLAIYNLLTHCCTPGTACDSEQLNHYCVGDIDAELDIAPSTISHHLKELHRASLITMHRQGKQVFCALNPETLAQLNDFFQDKSSEVPQ